MTKRVLLIGLSALALWIGWVGFLASDDALYYDAALHWLDKPPFAGDSHWATRYPVVLSLAAMAAIFGRGLLALGLSALIWYIALVAIVAGLSSRTAGHRAGWIAAMLTATLPVVTTNASIVNCDLPEAVFLLGGTWLLAEARHRSGAIAAGTVLGLAIFCRETALLALAGLGLLFLAERPVPRHRLVMAGIGMLAVLGAEMLFQYALTGDPLRRYGLAFHHDPHIDRAANLENNLLVHPLIDPLLVLLINNEFGLLFWFGGAALSSRDSWRAMLAAQGRTLLSIATLAATSFVLIGLLHDQLVLNPRYFTFAALAMVLIVAAWLSRLRPSVANIIVGVIVATNLLLLGLANRHPHWPGEALAMAARDHPREIITSDAETTSRADLLLRFQGSTNVRATPSSPAGALWLVMSPTGHIVSIYPSPPTRIGAVVQWLGLSALIPEQLRRRLLAPNDPAYLVKSPD